MSRFVFSNSAATEGKILAVLDMVGATILLLLVSVVIYLLYDQPQVIEDFANEDVVNRQDIIRFLNYERYKQMIFLVTTILRALFAIGLGILLVNGIRQNSYCQVKFWLVVGYAYFILEVLFFVPRILYVQNAVMYALVSIISLIYMVYELWVVDQILSSFEEVEDSKSEDEEEAPPTETEEMPAQQTEPSVPQPGSPIPA